MMSQSESDMCLGTTTTYWLLWCHNQSLTCAQIPPPRTMWSSRKHSDVCLSEWWWRGLDPTQLQRLPGSCRINNTQVYAFSFNTHGTPSTCITQSENTYYHVNMCMASCHRPSKQREGDSGCRTQTHNNIKSPWMQTLHVLWWGYLYIASYGTLCRQDLHTIGLYHYWQLLNMGLQVSNVLCTISLYPQLIPRLTTTTNIGLYSTAN